LDIVDKGFSHALLTSTSRPRAPGGRGDPPKPGSGGLTGYEGERSSTSDPSPGASLVAERSSPLRSWTRKSGHSGGRVQGDGVGRGVGPERRGLDHVDSIHGAWLCIFFTDYYEPS